MTTAKRRGMAPGGGLRLPALLLSRCPWAPLRAGLVTLLVAGVLAVEATRAGLLPVLPAPPDPRPDDPVIARVGDVPLRLSELRAEAGDGQADLSDLERDGVVARAADQLALAVQAEEDGLHEALEVRAALALARRRVLAEAYLGLAVSRATNETALRAAYEAEAAEAARGALVSVRSARFADRDAAARAGAQLRRGVPFDQAARRAGGRAEGPTGLVPVDALPPALAERAARLAAGALSEPFEAPLDVGEAEAEQDGPWVLLRVEARRGEAILPYEARRDALARSARAEALRDASRAAGLTPREASAVASAAAPDGADLP